MHYELKADAAPAKAGTPAQLLDWARQHPRWLVITGAGCSTAVGIPAYRDLSGRWTRTPPVTYQAFLGDPYTRQRYWARSLAGWPVMGQAQPGEAGRSRAHRTHCAPAHAECGWTAPSGGQQVHTGLAWPD